MTDQQIKKDYEEKLIEELKELQVKYRSSNDEKVKAELSAIFSNKLYDLTASDNKHRIALGVTIENWDGT